MSKTLTQLTETTTANTYDVVHVVDIDNNQDKKIKMANLWGTKPYGELSLNGNTNTTTISVAGTKVNITTGSTTTTAGLLNKFTHDSATGRLTYTGTEDIKVEICASLTGGRSGGAGSNVLSASIHVGGAEVTKSEIRQLVSGQGASPKGSRNLVSKCVTTLSKDDYVELYVGNEDDTTDQVIEYLNLSVATL